MADPIPAAPAKFTLSPGWQTTEHWMAYFVLFALLAAGGKLVALLPVILADPALPPWVKLLAPLIIPAIGALMHLVQVEYSKQRLALKLDANSPDVAGALTAGRTAAEADPAATLAKGNE